MMANANPSTTNMNMKTNKLLLLIIVALFTNCSSDDDNSSIEITPQNIIAKWVATEMLKDNAWIPVDTTRFVPTCIVLSEDGYYWTEGMIYKNGFGQYKLDGNTVVSSEGKDICRFKSMTAYTAQAYVCNGEGNYIQFRFQRDETARYLYLPPKKWLIGTWRINGVQDGIAEFTDTKAKIIYGDMVRNESYGRSSVPWIISIGSTFSIYSANLNVTPYIMYLYRNHNTAPIKCCKIQ